MLCDLFENLQVVAGELIVTLYCIYDLEPFRTSLTIHEGEEHADIGCVFPFISSAAEHCK